MVSRPAVRARIRGWLDATDEGRGSTIRLGAAVLVERGRPSAAPVPRWGAVLPSARGRNQRTAGQTALRRELARPFPRETPILSALGALGVAYHF